MPRPGSSRAVNCSAAVRRHDGGLAQRAPLAAGLVTAAVLAPAPAHAQDISALVVLAAPPFLLSPLVAASIRHALWRRTNGRSAVATLVVAVAEFLLWMLLAWFAVVATFKEEWSAALVAAALIACIPLLHWLFGPAQRSWPRSLAQAAVFPVTWLVLQLLWYAAFVLWG